MTCCVCKKNLDFIFLLQLLRLDVTSIQSMKLDPVLDWEIFYQLLIRHRVWHQTQSRISFVDDAKFLQLASYCKQDKLRILTAVAETVRIVRSFTEANIQYCVIKGVILNKLIYVAMDVRPCSDIDIWVSLSDYSEAIVNLVSLGYQQILPTYPLDGYIERYYMTHKHDMAFYHPERKQLVELHFRLSYLGMDYFLPTIDMCKTVSLFNTPVLTFEDNYHLLYLMLHGCIHAWIRLRWLNDIALYILSKKCDLKQVMSLAKQIHCEHIVEQSLILVRDLLGVEDIVLSKLIVNPSRRVILITNLAKQFIASDYEMTEGLRNLKMFIKYRYYLMRVAVKRQKINALVGDFFKIDRLFPYIRLPKKLAFMYYFLYLGWVLRVIWKALKYRAKGL